MDNAVHGLINSEPNVNRISKALTSAVRVGLFTLLFSHCVFAETLLIRANKHDFPATYLRNNHWQGMDILLIREILLRANLDYQFVEKPFKRSLAELHSGDIALMPNLVKNEERSVYLNWIGPTRITCIGLVVLDKDKVLPITSLDDLINIAQQKQKKVAYPHGASYSAFFDFKLKHESTLKDILYFVDDDTPKHKMLKKNRIMGYFADQFEAKRRLLDSNFADKYQGLTLHSYRIEESCTGAYIGLSKKLPKRHYQKLLTAFQSMKDDGSFDKIHLKWTGINPTF